MSWEVRPSLRQISMSASQISGCIRTLVRWPLTLTLWLGIPTFVLAFLLGIVFLASAALAGEVTGIPMIIDGDTLEIHGQRIRLHGIDAPESRQICRLDGKPWQCGKDAANALADKIGRRTVACEELDRDRYRRIVAKCTVAGEDLGEWMVSQGLALASPSGVAYHGCPARQWSLSAY